LQHSSDKRIRQNYIYKITLGNDDKDVKTSKWNSYDVLSVVSNAEIQGLNTVTIQIHQCTNYVWVTYISYTTKNESQQKVLWTNKK